MKTRILSGALALGLVIACSSGGSSKSEGSSTYAQAVCAYSQRCQPKDLAEEFGDVGTCQTDYAQILAVYLGLPGTTVTGAQLDACASALNGLSCEAGFGDVPACESLTGSLPAGAACVAATQCASGDCETSDSSTGNTPPPTDDTVDCGKCRALADLGQPCALATPCKQGLACDTTKNQCVALLAKGAACQATNPMCADGTRCINGTCTDPLAVGAACDPQQDQCQEALECDAQTKVCTDPESKDQLVDIGQPCGIMGGSDPSTTYNASCKAGASCLGTTTQTCVALATEGQPCVAHGSEDQTKPRCALLLSCIGGVCKKTDYTTCK